MDGASLWVIVGNTTVAKYDANKLCQSVGDAEATPAALLSLPKAHLALPAALSVSPKTNEVAVADLATSQVQVFSESGAFLKSLGQSGGYATGGPEVSAKRFLWLNSTQVFLAHEDDGSLWVADAANLRTLHVDSEGRFIDSTDYVVASYSSAVHSEQPTRVFSNYREYAVKYSALATPLNESWALVRNWAAGLDANWTTDNSHFEGFHTVVATADNKTVGMVRMANGKDSLVELPSDGTGLRLIYQLPSGGYSLERGASLRYSVDHWQRGSQAAGVQEIWEVAYDVAAGNWSLPGRLVTSFATASDQLASRFAGVQPSFPTTAKGDFVIFDGATGKNESYNHAPNQGNHLGVVGTGANSSFTWQAIQSCSTASTAPQSCSTASTAPSTRSRTRTGGTRWQRLSHQLRRELRPGGGAQHCLRLFRGVLEEHRSESVLALSRLRFVHRTIWNPVAVREHGFETSNSRGHGR
eukprot:SAG11_NODE_1392_length_5048_cov_2.551020_2_plen_470_part_00